MKTILGLGQLWDNNFGLKFFGLITLSLVLIFLNFRFAFAATNIFYDGFGTGGTDTTFNEDPSWIEGGDSAEKHSSNSHTKSPDGGRYAQIGGEDGYICREFNMQGHNSVFISYYWRGDIPTESNDKGIVEFKPANSGTCNDNFGWTTLKTHSLLENKWSFQESFSNTGFNDTLFLLKFRTQTDSSTEDFRVDGILITDNLSFGTGSIKATKNTIGGDGTFNFQGSDVRTFEIETKNGLGVHTLTNLQPGSYAIEEVPQEGWDIFESTCDDIEVISGQTTECQITNTKRGSITVYKNVLSPSGQEVTDNQVFQVSLNNQDAQSIFENQPYIFENLSSGTYTVSEILNDNYEFISFSQDGNENADDGAQITIESGQSAALIIANRQKRAVLLVKKIVSNSFGLGEASSEDFTIKVQGNNVSSSSFSGNSNGTAITLDPGNFSISETGPAGYAMSVSRDCFGSISSDESLTCIITNSDIKEGNGAITVIKKVINDDSGQLSPDDFNIFLTRQGQGQISVENGQAEMLDPGNYFVEEILPKGYEQTSLICTDGQTLTNGQVNLLEQKSWVCTITNDDIPAKLTIKKETGNENHNGIFVFEISNIGADAKVITNAGVGQTSIELDSGTYNVSEVASQGWTISAVSCESQNGGTGEESENGIQFSVENGQEVVCTFVNERQMGNLVVIKDVKGSEESPASWQIHIKSEGDEVKDSPQDGQSGEGTTYILPMGSYVISETGEPTGYAVEFSGDCDENGQIEVLKEEISTCIITNTLKGSLIVKKVVINDNGGTKTAGDFSFKVNGGASVALESDGQNNLTVSAGIHTVTENAFEGYAVFYENCQNLQIADGQEEICIITNNDIQPPVATISGGGGGGGGGSDNSNAGFAGTLSIVESSVRVLSVTWFSAIVYFETNLPSSGYAVYSQKDQAKPMNLSNNFPNPPSYGYAQSSEQVDLNSKTTSHIVTLSGLNENTTYYFRVISQSPLAFSNEYQLTTTVIFNPVARLGQGEEQFSGIGGPISETQEPAVAGEQDINLEETGEGQEPQLSDLVQPAALFGSGWGEWLMGWILDNLWWLLLTLIILAIIIYYWWENRKQQNSPNPPSQPTIPNWPVSPNPPNPLKPPNPPNSPNSQI